MGKALIHQQRTHLSTSSPTLPIERCSKQTMKKKGEGFNYEQFYTAELDKKKKDNSYRIFNNINRIAEKFPTAYTGSGDHVTVWCSNGKYEPNL